MCGSSYLDGNGNVPLTVCAQTLYPGHIWGFVAVIKDFFFLFFFCGCNFAFSPFGGLSKQRKEMELIIIIY